MSRQLVSHSPDLLQLQDEGYDIEIRNNNLLIKHVPYVTAERTVAYGILVSELSTSGTCTTTPATHVASFVGSIPCDDQGRELDELINQRGPINLDGELVASCTFSHKPAASYPNYYEKMTTYADMLMGYAQVIDRTVIVKTHPPIRQHDDESVFRYLDSASSRARIGAVTRRLQLERVAIVGLGGTGSYILDFVAKTPVNEIHLYDHDRLHTHNAFRAPGASTLEELDSAPKKVDYFQARYDPMHRMIVAHDAYVDESNIDELRGSSFVFVAIDGGPAKKFIIEKLEEFGIPFVDTGMGIYQVGDSLGGIVRTTASTPQQRQHVWENDRISFADEGDDEYDQNIQIADLNALNAVMAVIKWKKLFGFYTDFEKEYSSTYTIDGNHLLNQDQAS